MRVAIAGLGLIGGSFEKASKQAGHEIVPLAKAELVLVCLPPDVIVPWIGEHRGEFAAEAVVVDVCGIKRKICRELAEMAKSAWTFVGGHPMAGREVSGYENSKADLFVGASMILTPDESVPESVIAMLKRYFESVGFLRTVLTTPEKHDEMIAFTSQLCHVIATAYARDPKVIEAIGYSAGSYANMTRVATQNAETWASLYLEDREALLRTLDGFIGRLGEFREALSAADLPRMKRIIEEGTKAKNEELLARERGDER